MAYVAISGDFIDRVERKIQTMLRAELATIGEEPKPVVSGHEPFVTKAVWGDHAHFKEILPVEWCNHQESLRIKFAVPGQLNKKGDPLEYNTSISFTKSVKFPPRFASYDNQAVPNTEPILAELVEWSIKMYEIRGRWDAVEDKIKEFLHSCKSANEAVKLWPDVKMYFDAGDIKRLEVKNSRSESTSDAAKVLAGIDTGEVMSAAVIARLSGAQV